MKIYQISFCGRIKTGDIINRLKDIDRSANRAVEKFEQRVVASSNNLEAKILENPANPTPLDHVKMLTSGTTTTAPTIGGLATTVYRPIWDVTTIV